MVFNGHVIYEESELKWTVQRETFIMKVDGQVKVYNLEQDRSVLLIELHSGWP